MRKHLLLLLAALLLPSCTALTASPTTTPKASSPSAISHSGKNWKVRSTLHGKASWYSVATNYGTRTASGERLSNNAFTAAHKTLPLGTKVRVTNLSNGKSEILRITDRGPYIKGRIIDVTIGSAQRLGFYSKGVTSVKVEVLSEIKESTSETASLDQTTEQES